VNKIGFKENPAAIEVVKRYATNGREAVNIIQLAAGIAITENRDFLEPADIEWVVNSSQIPPRPEKKITLQSQIGLVNGLAVYGPNLGILLEIEVTAIPISQPGAGSFNITGIIDEEETGGGNKTLRRKSMARGSVENVLTVLRRLGFRPSDYDLHINFPGGVPIDGPSAGISMATAIVSALYEIPVDHKLAMTGEVSIHGKVKPIGGVVAKVEAALQAGANKVIIPKENWQEFFANIEGVQVIPVDSIEEVFYYALGFELQKLPMKIPVDAISTPPTLPVLHAKLD
jgi:Lon-like ATP-dependent protease